MLLEHMDNLAPGDFAKIMAERERNAWKSGRFDGLELAAALPFWRRTKVAIRKLKYRGGR